MTEIHILWRGILLENADDFTTELIIRVHDANLYVLYAVLTPIQLVWTSWAPRVTLWGGSQSISAPACGSSVADFDRAPTHVPIYS